MFGRHRQGSAEDPAWFRCENCEEIAQHRGQAALLRVCGACGHHAPLSAQERVEMVCDEGSFEPLFSQLRGADPLHFRGKTRYRNELKGAQKATGAPESVLVGEGRAGGESLVVVASEGSFLQGTLGATGGERVARALELAREKRVSVLLTLSSAGFRHQEGAYAAAILPRIIIPLAALRRSGLTTVVIAAGVVRGAAAVVASCADVCWCEPGARVEWRAPVSREGTALPRTTAPAFGAVVPRPQQRARLVALMSALGQR